MSDWGAGRTRLVIQPVTDVGAIIEEFVVDLDGCLPLDQVERVARSIPGRLSPVPYRLHATRNIVEWGASGNLADYLLQFLAQPYVSGAFYLFLGAWIDHLFGRRRARKPPDTLDAVSQATHTVLLRHPDLVETDLDLWSTEENRDDGTITVVLNGPSVEYRVAVRRTQRGITICRIREAQRTG
ncbi:hypothetical protein GCM10022198_17680 [Klugiella xanthotipulae]|uniref:Uncharacterized protein n=1 Tax=Klugiella xanthotipulae TaxID=244735 RepID=A0A543HXG9_9MICO|nr:hypothetical protein [Klugiella xanthotipulae]TQM63063.1 hypothetical protein FB466_1312 [Klugiella xanthotipulae]